MTKEIRKTEQEKADKQRARNAGSKVLVVACGMTLFFAVPIALMLVL